MVKHWIVMVVLAVILAAGCVVESIYVNKSFDWLIGSLESLQVELSECKDDIDKDEFKTQAESIHKEWHKRVKILKCIIWHTGIKDVWVGLARISTYIDENDYTEAYAEIQSLIDYAKHYSDDFSVSLENIF